MSEWKEYFLKDFAEIQTGPFGSLLHASDYVSEGTPSIMPTNIGSRLNIVTDNIIYVGDNDINRLQKYLVNEGDIVYSRRGDVEKCALINEKQTGWLCGTGCLRIRIVKKGLSSKFCAYYLSAPDIKSWVLNSAVGTTMPNLNTTILGKLPLLIPELSEQTAIAEVLSSLDDKIDLLHRQNKTLEQLAETLFRQWFVEEAEESWEHSSLEKHTYVFRGLSYKGSGLTEKGLGLPLHNLNSVYEGGGYKYEGIKFYSGEYRDRHMIKAGDIIVANTEQGHEFRLIGFPAVVPDFYGEKGLFSQHIYKITPKETTYLTNEFIYYLLMTPTMREQITGATNGSTVNMLAIDGLQRPEFRLPSKEKVELFTTIVKDYWIKKNANHHHVTKLTQLRDTLLPKLMSGEVRVKHEA